MVHPIFSTLEREREWSVVKRAIKDCNSIQTLRDEEERTVLHKAAEKGDAQLVSLLLTIKKVDVNAKDENGWTPLHCACIAGHFDISILLITKGKSINVNIKNADQNDALRYLTKKCGSYVNDKNSELFYRVLGLIFQHGADANSSNLQGETALHAACGPQGSIYAAEFLLKQGAEVNSKNALNETPLHWAVQKPVLEIIKILVEYGADPFSASTAGGTPMGAMLDAKRDDIVSLLKKHSITCLEAKRENSCAAYLERQTDKSRWISSFCIVKEDLMLEYTNAEAAKPIRSYNISTAELVERVERPKSGKFCFELREKYRITVFAASSELLRQGWVGSITDSRKIMSRARFSLPTIAGVAVDQEQEEHQIEPDGGSIVESEEVDGYLTRALADSDKNNSKCADCNDPEPFWFIVRYSILVCYSCASIHAALKTSPIKSLYFDPWISNEAMSLISNGNKNFNTKREPGIPMQKPSASAPSKIKEEWISLKYSDSKHNKTKGKRTNTVKLAGAARGNQFENIYQFPLLLDALAITPPMWDAQESSLELKQIREWIFESTAPTLASMKALCKKFEAASSYGEEYMEDIITFTRQRRKGSETSESFEILLRLCKRYVELQSEIKDSHIMYIFRWWLPQAVEVLSVEIALQKEKHSKPEFSALHSFCEHSARSILLLMGSYLSIPHQVTQEAREQSSRSLEEQFASISTQFAHHTTAIRELITNTSKWHKKSKSSNSWTSERSYSEESAKFSQKTENFASGSTSIDLSSLHESSFSLQTSTGGDSPRGFGESLDEKSEYPLFSFVRSMPRAFSDTLCSLVVKLPEECQQELLGLLSSATSFIELQQNPFIDIFTCSPFNGESIIAEIHNHLEFMRLCWFERPFSDAPRFQDYLSRQILILNQLLRTQYEFAVVWTLPDVWELWHSLQLIFQSLLSTLLDAVSSPDISSSLVCKTLSLAIIQIEWTTKKLSEIQRIDICSGM